MMKPHSYLAILVRLFSIALFVFSIKQSNYFLQLAIYGDIQGLPAPIFQIFTSFFVPLCISMVLWFFPVVVAKSILKPEMDYEIEPSNKQSIFSILIATVGLYVSFYAFVDTTYYFTLWQLVNSPDGYSNINDLFNEDTKANIWATGVELVLGLVLILKSKTIAKKIFGICQ